MVALVPSLKYLTKSSISGFYKTSSTIDNSQAEQLDPKTAYQENPFLFSSNRRSEVPSTTEKRNDLASTKKWLSIPTEKAY
jgi:hypothetical protein